MHPSFGNIRNFIENMVVYHEIISKYFAIIFTNCFDVFPIKYMCVLPNNFKHVFLNSGFLELQYTRGSKFLYI